MKQRSAQPKSDITYSLADAFDSFNTTVTDLGSSYQELMKRIQELNIQISEKNKKLEENFYEVNRLRRFLDSILNSMTDGVIVVDTAGRIVLFNKGAENLTGFSHEEVIGQTYTMVFGKQISERFSLLYTLSEGISLLLEEKEINTKYKKNIPVRYSTSLVTDSQNRTLGAVEVFSDLSRIKWLEDQMRQMKIQTALNQMAGLVAHEIRNPLGGIRGYVDLLSESMTQDDTHRQMVGHIIDSIKRLDEIVANFQLFTRPVKPQFEDTDMVRFIGEVLAFFGKNEEMRKKKTRVVADFLTKAKPIQLSIDPILIEQALLFILDNAVKSMQMEGTLRIELREETPLNKRVEKQILISISDTGAGMSKQVLKKLFTPFFTTRERGMGLGLALARNFVVHHRGDI
ncbi:ATP-binding protein, partial [bacterium]|nr:ATP-binding protein [bacterium]